MGRLKSRKDYNTKLLPLLHDDRSDKIKLTCFVSGESYKQDASQYPHSIDAQGQRHLQGGQQLIYMPDISFEKSTNLFHFLSPKHKVCGIKGEENFGIALTRNEQETDMRRFNSIARVGAIAMFIMAKMTNRGPRDEVIISSAKQPESSLSRFSIKAGHMPKQTPTSVYVNSKRIKAEHERNPDSPATRVLEEPLHVSGYTQTLAEKEVTVERQDGTKYTYTRKARVTEVSPYVRGAKPGEEVPSPPMRSVRAVRDNQDTRPGSGG